MGDGKILLEMGASQNGRDRKFLKSLCIVGRGVLNPRFYEDPPIANPTPPFLKILSNTPPPPPHLHLPATSNLRPHCSFCCPISLLEWVIMPLDVLIYLMIIWTCTCRALVPFNQGFDVCFMQQVAKFTEV